MHDEASPIPTREDDSDAHRRHHSKMPTPCTQFNGQSVHDDLAEIQHLANTHKHSSWNSDASFELEMLWHVVQQASSLE